MMKNKTNNWKQLTRKVSFAEFLFMLCFAFRIFGAIQIILIPIGIVQWSLGLRGYMFWDREIQVWFLSVLFLLCSIAGLNSFRKKLGEDTLNFAVEVFWMLTFGVTATGAIITIGFGGHWLLGLINGVPYASVMIWPKIIFISISSVLWIAGWFGLKQWNKKLPGWGLMSVKKKKHVPKNDL